MLFDQVQRDSKAPRGHVEPYFSYLNRSARPSSEKMRAVLEDWFSRYPSEAKNELRTRFRSLDNIQHQSAFFELYLHELLLKLGYTVKVHPDLGGRPTHPEFLVFLKGEPVFYLEGTLASGPKEENATEKRENQVYETIDKIHSPNFFLKINVRGSPNTPPPGKKWSLALEKWLATLDPNELEQRMKANDFGVLPSKTLNHDGWNVTFQAIPKSPKARGKSGIRPIGMRFFGFEECKEDEYIRNAIKEKATKYGNLNIPYIIAINVLSLFSNDDLMILDALLGDEGITSYHMPDGSFVDKLTREPNGAFLGPQGPQNTRVSGIIICSNLYIRNITKVNPVLWHNPWAAIPFKQDFWVLPQWIFNSDIMRLEPIQGRNIADVFCFPQGWPIQNGEKDLE
jgi:hypothetical protein